MHALNASGMHGQAITVQNSPMNSSTNQAASSPWVFGHVQAHAVRGLIHGLATPSVRLWLALDGGEPERAEAALRGLQRLASCLGLTIGSRTTEVDRPTDDVDAQLRLWMRVMVHALGQVDATLSHWVAGAPILLRGDGLTGLPMPGYVLLWPTHWPQVLIRVLVWSLGQWHALASDEGPSPQDRDALLRAWATMAAGLKQQLPAGLNPPRLLTAARELGRPVFWHDRETLQVGHGRRARLLQSTLTDSTPTVGVAWARDKVRTNRLLRQAGVPVPLHVEVANVQDAVRAAEQLGWPVVVKPADQDCGSGARANLSSPEQVSAAFELANQISERVLVEKHQAGGEYRLTVVNGRLLWAYERVPASVMGDGVQSLQALLEQENNRRRQALLTQVNGLVPIRLDADSLAYLGERGHSLQEVPAAGEVVRLQRVPASSGGGSGRACFNEMHADNRWLAERAARLLRLDIAGVDLIMPDITRSWREVGGAVTEVNAIPQVIVQTEPTLARRLLAEVMPDSGRIPLLFVLAEQAPTWLDEVTRRLEAAGLRVGMTTPQGLQIGGDWVRGPRVSLWDDIRALQTDPDTGAMVVVGEGMDLLGSGLPFDAVDALVVMSHRPQVLSLLMPYLRDVRAVVGQALEERYGELIQSAERPWNVWPESPAATTDWTDALGATLLAVAQGHTPGQGARPESTAAQSLASQAWGWLETWRECIAAQDYEGAKCLFDEAVVGFGTVSHRAQGLPQLMKTQWQQVWGRTRHFVFVPGSLEVWPSGDQRAMTVAVQWTSVGVDANSGESFARQGRATIVLERQGTAWRARHTHFSLNPSPERFLPQA